MVKLVLHARRNSTTTVDRANSVLKIVLTATIRKVFVLSVIRPTNSIKIRMFVNVLPVKLAQCTVVLRTIPAKLVSSSTVRTVRCVSKAALSVKLLLAPARSASATRN